MGPTRVQYLLGGGAVAGASKVATATAAAGAGTKAGAGPGLELLTWGGEDCYTLGQKLCPLRVFTMARLEKDKRWRGWEKRRFHK